MDILPKGFILFQFALFVNLFCFGTHPSQSIDNEDLYDYHFWNSSHGLPQNSVNGITQDSTGYIWFTTYDGIVRFDGKNFKVFNTQNTPSLPANRWNNVLKGPGDELYFFTYEGYLAHWKNGEFSGYKITMGNYFLNASFYDSQLGVVFAQGNKIKRLTSGKIEEYYTMPDSLNINRISSVVKDPQSDALFIGTGDSGAVYKLNLRTNRLTTVIDFVGVTANMFCHQGRLYVLSNEELRIVEKGETIEVISLPDRPLPVNGYAIMGDEIFLSLRSSLFVYNTQTSASYNISPKGNNERYSLQYVFADRDQTLWGGTTSKGLFRVRKRIFEFYDDFDISGGVEVNPIILDSKNRILAGLSCSGVADIDENGNIHIREKVDVSKGDRKQSKIDLPHCIHSIFEDDSGNIWYGTYNYGLLVEKTNGEFSYYFSDLQSGGIKAIQQFGKYIYVGHTGGISLYSMTQDRFLKVDSVFENAHLIKDEFINYFYRLDNDDIIVGTEKSGAFVLGSDQNIKPFANTADVNVPNIRAVYQDSAGNVWLGSYGNGLLFWESGTDSVRVITKRQGLYDNVVSAIVENEGDFYMTCNRGLYKVSIADLYGFLEGHSSRIYCESFGSSNQFKQIEFNGGFQQTFAKTNRGTILFPSFSGVVEFDPGNLNQISTPEVVFDMVLVNGNRVENATDGLNLQHDFFSVSFRIAAPSFAFNQNLITEYRLKGFNDEWQTLRADHVVEFSRLPPGDYVIEARAKHLSNPKGNFNYAKMQFSVNAPFWRRPVVIASTGLFAVLIVLIWLYINKKNNEKKALKIKRLLEEKTQSLRETTANLEAVINNTDELIWCVDTDFNLLVANEAYLKVHHKRYGVELLRGESIFKRAPQKVRDFWRPHFDKTLCGKKSKLQVRGESRTGREIINEVSFYPIYKEGEIAGLVGFTKEITEVKHREQQLKNAMQISKDAAKSKSEFLATMSHEIRTPINAVIGMTSLLQHTELSREQTEYVENIRFGGETLLQIINDILDFSKGEANKLTLENYNFNIRESIANTVSLIEDKAREKGITIQQNIDEDVPQSAKADESKLRQVLLNLLSNSVKFTENGRIDINCRWENGKQGNVRSGRLFISVADTGIGIPRDKIKTLFSPFVQVDAGTNRKFGGTGLGLAISKKIVERMGGEIDVKSELGKGTAFEFFIQCKTVSIPDGSNSGKVDGFLCVLDVHDDSLKPKVEEVLSKSKVSFTKSRNNESKNVILITDRPLESDEYFDNVIFIMDRESKVSKQRRGAYVVKTDEIEAALLPAIKKINTESLGSSLEKVDKLEEVKKLSILVAEDNPVNQKLVQMILQKLGLSCDVAANGLEVLEALERSRYDFIYMDCQMPEMDGFEATAEIRNRPEFSKIIIVAMTANAMKEDRARCLNAGMDDYLPKPIDLATVKKNLIKWSEILNNEKTHEIQ